MKKYIILIALICLMSATSCGSLTGLYSTVTFDSNPPGAEITRNHQVIGRTPMKMKLKNSKNYNIIISYPDFQNRVYQFDKEISTGTIFANILFTGGTGLIIDAATGGFYKYHNFHNQKIFYDFQIGKTIVTPEIKYD